MRKLTISVLSLALLPGLAVGLVQAGSSAMSAINWQVLAGGGQPAAGSGVSLNGTFGQPVVGPAAGGQVDIGAGYWYGTGRSATIYLPIVLGNFVAMPDLRVDSLVATTHQVTLVIRNAGSAPVTDDFWVDVYFNPTPAPPPLNRTWQSIAPYGADWGVIQSLAPGESLTLTVGGPYYAGGSGSFPAGAPVYATVDSINYATTYGNVQESNEANNVFGPVVSTAGLGTVTRQVKPASLAELPER
jgi:hypothetical protein